jgi:hypothetical protein
MVPAARRRVWINFGYNTLTLALFGFWLIAIYPTTEAHDSPDWSAASSKLAIPTTAILRTNLIDRILHSVYPDRLWMIGAAGLVLLVLPALRRETSRIALVTLFSGAVLWLGIVSLFGAQSFRQFISASAFLIVLAGAGLSLWVTAAIRLIERGPWQVPPLRLRQAGSAVALIAVALLTRQQLSASIDNTRNHLLHDRRNDLAAYADSSLESGSYIATAENHKTFNRDWGGYRGTTRFPFLKKIATLTSQPITYWREQGVKYAILPYYNYSALKDTPQGQEYLAQTVLLKAYPPSTHYRGPAMVVLALEPMEHAASGQLGPIHLIGYDIDHVTVHPGESFTFRLYWQSDQALDADYVVYNHLAPLDSRDIVAQIDGPPLVTTRRGTSNWDDPTETLVSEPFTLTLGEDVAPGTYRLITGFYRRDTFERLQDSQGDDYLTVTEIVVGAPEQATAKTPTGGE